VNDLQCRSFKFVNKSESQAISQQVDTVVPSQNLPGRNSCSLAAARSPNTQRCRLSIYHQFGPQWTAEMNSSATFRMGTVEVTPLRLWWTSRSRRVARSLSNQSKAETLTRTVLSSKTSSVSIQLQTAQKLCLINHKWAWTSHKCREMAKSSVSAAPNPWKVRPLSQILRTPNPKNKTTLVQANGSNTRAQTLIMLAWVKAP